MTIDPHDSGGEAYRQIRLAMEQAEQQRTMDELVRMYRDKYQPSGGFAVLDGSVASQLAESARRWQETLQRIASRDYGSELLSSAERIQEAMSVRSPLAEAVERMEGAMSVRSPLAEALERLQSPARDWDRIVHGTSFFGESAVYSDMIDSAARLRDLNSQIAAMSSPIVDALKNIQVADLRFLRSPLDDWSLWSTAAGAALAGIGVAGAEFPDAQSIATALEETLTDESFAGDADETVHDYAQRLATAVAARRPKLDATFLFQYFILPLLVGLLIAVYSAHLNSRDMRELIRHVDRVDADVKAPVKPKRYVAVRAIVVREFPGGAARVSARLAAGSSVLEKDRQGRWRYIRAETVDGVVEGWVFYRNLRPDN